MDGATKGVKIGMGRRGVSFLEDRREWRLPSLLYADDLILYGESEEDLRMMVRRYAKVYRRGLRKVIAGKSKVMVLNEEEGLEHEIHEDGIH